GARAEGCGDGGRSRHARSQEVQTATGKVFVKSYPPPGASRARRAFAMGRALAAAGFAAPRALLVGSRAGAGLLVTVDAGGDDLLATVAGLAGGGPRPRRTQRAPPDAPGVEGAPPPPAGVLHRAPLPPPLPVRA